MRWPSRCLFARPSAHNPIDESMTKRGPDSLPFLFRISRHVSNISLTRWLLCNVNVYLYSFLLGSRLPSRKLAPCFVCLFPRLRHSYGLLLSMFGGVGRLTVPYGHKNRWGSEYITKRDGDGNEDGQC
ncbi:hypothetical protein BU23DRAFT_240744 [Bimuria novae-zelandiae CBS 107.79]|uniref:Uncharacterized protein n=1 Tax=Bimuria novae-zelandiae CBS 107.79 TaxID=1447943 RepID=A0A6A5UX52_9PLEO|nr:hypothetical protein BU23DRAFT_240744 [Bimuria novae-zelandiae CBS 107.79]